MRQTRRLLLSGTVVLAATALSLSCASAEEWGYDYGGYANFSGYLIDQDEIPGDEIPDVGFAADAHVRGRAKVILDNGIELGVRAQLRFQSSEAEFSDDLIRGAPDFLDKFYIYGQHAFGRLTIGDDYGAAKQNGIFSPIVSDANRIDDPKHYPLQDPLRGAFTPFAPNGAHIRTDLAASGESFKIMYSSPRLLGLELDISYMPELTRGLNDLFDSDDDINQQSDIWEANLSFQKSLGGFDFGAYVGYLIGDNERPRAESVMVGAVPSVVFVPDDVQEYGAGAQIAYEGFRFGGSWRHTNIAGGGPLRDDDVGPLSSVGCNQLAGCVLPDSDTEIWGVGLTYETGPWTFGVNYAHMNEELPPLMGLPGRVDQEAEAWQGTIGYEIGTGIDIYLGYQHYNFDGPTGQCSGVACDSMEADIGFLQTAFSFP